MAKPKTHQIHTKSQRPGQTNKSIKRLQMTLRSNEALMLRNRGFTYNDIAGQLNMGSPAAAHNAVREAMKHELSTSADLAHERLESDAFYRQLIKLLMPFLLRPKPMMTVVPHLIALRKRLDEIWGLGLGAQIGTGISDLLTAVLHELDARPLASASPEPARAALPDPSTLDAIWDEMESSGEVESASSPAPDQEPQASAGLDEIMES